MKNLTTKQKLNLYKESLNYSLNWHKWTPKFTIGNKVRIINVGVLTFSRCKNENSDIWTEASAYSVSVWNHLNFLRIRRIGEVGIIIRIDILKTLIEPVQHSPYSYTVRFEDGQEITFSEEYLQKIKNKVK